MASRAIDDGTRTGDSVERAFDFCPDEYTRGRPTYPDEAVGAIVRFLAMEPGDLVLDVGAGTGVMSNLLSGSGLRPVAADRSANMLAQIARTVPAVIADAAALPFVDACFGGIVAATSFHWFATDAALHELRRVLREERNLVLTWNDADSSSDFVDQHIRLMQSHVGDVPQFRTMHWRVVMDSFLGFRYIGGHETPNPTQMDHATFIDRVRSTSFIAALDVEARDSVIGQARELVRAMPDQFTYPYVTRTFVFRKR